MDGHEDRYLMAIAESMLRAGYGQRQIERALRRMSPSAETTSGLLAFRSLRRLLSVRVRKFRQSPQPVSASSK
jgi:hypothetical protein